MSFLLIEKSEGISWPRPCFLLSLCFASMSLAILFFSINTITYLVGRNLLKSLVDLGEIGMVCECNAVWSPRSHGSTANVSFTFKVNPVNSGGSLFLFWALDLQSYECSGAVWERAALVTAHIRFD